MQKNILEHIKKQGVDKDNIVELLGYIKARYHPERPPPYMPILYLMRASQYGLRHLSYVRFWHGFVENDGFSDKEIVEKFVKETTDSAFDRFL